MNSKQKLIVALDQLEANAAIDLAQMIAPEVWGFKVNDLLLREGAKIIKEIKKFSKVFADPKLHDIPNTVVNSVKALEDMGADLITVHASGGPAMLEAAAKSCTSSKLLAVTVLTSMDEESSSVVYNSSIAETVKRFIHLAVETGIDGLVCSPKELELACQESDVKFIKLCPGIRPIWYKKIDDQSRFLSPQQAIDLGSNFLVVGRPITQNNDPVAAAKRIVAEIDA